MYIYLVGNELEWIENSAVKKKTPSERGFSNKYWNTLKLDFRLIRVANPIWAFSVVQCC